MTTKLSKPNKKCSKLTLKQRRINPSDVKNEITEEKKWPSPKSLKSVPDKIPTIDFKVGDNVIQSFSAVYDKPVIKARVSKGKENREFDPYHVDLMTPDSARYCLPHSKNDRKSCRRYSSDHYHDNGSSRKKRLVEGISNGTSSNTTGSFNSTKNINESTSEKIALSSSGKSSKYFSCSEKDPKYSTLIIPDSSFSSVERLCQKDREEKVDAKSVIVISDSSSTCSGEIISSPKRRAKHILSARTRDQRRGSAQKQRVTIVLDSSDSENEILEASIETPKKWRTPLGLGSKSQPTSKKERNSSIGFKPAPQLPLAKNGKYKDIENWLSRINIPQKNNHDDADVILEVSATQKANLPRNSSKIGTGLSASAENVLDKLYGSTWRHKNVKLKQPQTEPCVRKVLQTELAANPNTESKEHSAEKSKSSVSSTDSEDFDNFLKNVRRDFESTHQNANKLTLDTPEFIDDSVDDNSLGFYQGTTNKKEFKKDLWDWKWKADKNSRLYDKGPAKQLTYSSSDGGDTPAKDTSSSDSFPLGKMKKKLPDESRLKKSNKPSKVIVSPVKRLVVKKTPKTVGQARVKSRLNVPTKAYCSPVPTFLESLSATAPSGRCHPEARYYKDNFKKKKEELCSKLFKMFNKRVFDNKLPEDMLVQWNIRMKRTAGFCYNRRTLKSPGTKIRTSRIELSTKVCDTTDRLRDTLIHELCHAATWIVDDVKDGHGPCWKAWARKAMRTYPELPAIKRCHDYKIQTKFTYRCTGCGYSIGRHSKSLDIVTKRCGYCYGVFELLVNTRRKSGTIAQQTLKKRSPVGFARFVKENYKSVKQSRTDLKHGDVMRLLGQQFSAVKIGSVAAKP